MQEGCNDYGAAVRDGAADDTELWKAKMSRNQDGIKSGVHHDRPNRDIQRPDCITESAECPRLYKHHKAKGNPDAGKEQILLSSFEGCSPKPLHPKEGFGKNNQGDVNGNRQNEH